MKRPIRDKAVVGNGDGKMHVLLFFDLFFTRDYMFFAFSKGRMNLQCAIKCLGMKKKCFFVIAE